MDYYTPIEINTRLSHRYAINGGVLHVEEFCCNWHTIGNQTDAYKAVMAKLTAQGMTLTACYN